MIVVGSPTSSNSSRLRELAARLGTAAHMVDSADELRADMVRRHRARGPDGRRLGARGAGTGLITRIKELGRCRCAR